VGIGWESGRWESGQISLFTIEESLFGLVHELSQLQVCLTELFKALGSYGNAPIRRG
jgi:hypothetical protein